MLLAHSVSVPPMATPHWVNPRYSPNAPFDFSMKMHETSVRMGHILAAASFKADAVQCAVDLLAWPDSSDDESEPSTEDCADSGTAWP